MKSPASPKPWKNVDFNRDGYDTAQCMPVQLQGLKACQDCPHKDIKEGDERCPSPEIRRTKKNSLGIEVPVQKKIMKP